MAYEAPMLTEVGSVQDLTLAWGGTGTDDKFMMFGVNFAVGDDPGIS